MRRLLKTAVSIVSGLALAGSVAIGTELPASAATGCDTTFGRYYTVKKGSRGSQAKAVQCLLRSAGYRVSTDGSISTADIAKVRAFQRSRHINTSGVVAARTWTALLSRGSQPTLRYGVRGKSVKRLQKSLTASGRPVPATGYFGPLTRNALRSYQRSRSLKVTGVATPAVWRKLQTGAKYRPLAAPRRASTSVSSSSQGARIVAFAKRQLGDSYVYGATGPNAWDCSGLTSGAYKSVGKYIPRTSQAQFRSGTKVSKGNLRPGDLVFFYSGISHVAIYAGNGYVVHAANPRSDVAMLKMSYMPYMGARRY